jgi:polar amino acid transport system substrate-binding protein
LIGNQRYFKAKFATEAILALAGQASLLVALLAVTFAGLATEVAAQSSPQTGSLPPAPPAAQSPGPADRRAIIRFLTDSDYPPFNYVHDDGALVGFNVDIARAICQDLGAACDVQTRAWDDLIPALKRGEADAVIASHMVTPKLLHDVDVTDRYYHTPGRFAALRETSRLEATPEALEGRKIAVARGTTHEAYLRAFFTLSTIVPYDSIEVAQDAVRTRAADLLFDDAISMAFWLQGTASRACCEFRSEPFFEPRFFGDGVGIAVGKGDGQLRGQINAALRRIRDSGKYEEIVLRYFPTRPF